jgi:hypothetical protein
MRYLYLIQELKLDVLGLFQEAHGSHHHCKLVGMDVIVPMSPSFPFLNQDYGLIVVDFTIDSAAPATDFALNGDRQ